MERLKWMYAIPPVYSWMQSLSEQMPSHDISIIVDDDYDTQLFWSSPHLNDCASSKTLADRAASLKAVFDGALYIVRGASYAPFSLGAPIRISGETSMGYDVGNASSDPFCPRYSAIRYNGNPDQHPYRHPVSRFVALAKRNDQVLTMLRTLGTNGPSFVTLYVLLDDIRHFGWTNERIEGCTDAASGAVKRFTGTANNRAGSGDGSRHGGEDGKPMKAKPMDLSEAQRLILPATRQLLDEIAKDEKLCSKI